MEEISSKSPSENTKLAFSKYGRIVIYPLLSNNLSADD